MKRSDFSYELPDELIARHPADQRSQSRMLQLDGASGSIHHGVFSDIVDLLHAGDLLVVNDTRVIPARIFGRKESGGRLELLVERVLDEYHVLAHVRASKSPKADSFILLVDSSGQDAVRLRVEGRREELFELAFPQNQPVSAVLDKIGHMPLPPYIDRADDQNDRERYQTVYNCKPGAVAAPTAGLHFDEAILTRLRDKGVDRASVTLHVGAGTFQPVRADNITEHKMHSEYLEVDEEVCRKVKQTREQGGRVIAVGTTAVRSLETASASGELRPYRGDSKIFIYPGYQFRSVDALLTNFHLPESTLIMLVSAFAGRENVLTAYREAVSESYRFFSYGDCMFVTPQHQSSAKMELSP